MCVFVGHRSPYASGSKGPTTASSRKKLHRWRAPPARGILPLGKAAACNRRAPIVLLSAGLLRPGAARPRHGSKAHAPRVLGHPQLLRELPAGHLRAQAETACARCEQPPSIFLSGSWQSVRSPSHVGTLSGRQVLEIKVNTWKKAWTKMRS